MNWRNPCTADAYLSCLLWCVAIVAITVEVWGCAVIVYLLKITNEPQLVPVRWMIVVLFGVAQHSCQIVAIGCLLFQLIAVHVIIDQMSSCTLRTLRTSVLAMRTVE